MKYFLAIDIGASSGRHIVGHTENGIMQTDEVYRFPNSVITADGHLCWDIDKIFSEVLRGIKIAFEKYQTIQSISIDTWGVDYVLLDNENVIYPVYAYRDERNSEVIDEVHKKIPFATLYEKTGIQYNQINTIYQLYWDKINNRLHCATDFLMIPEYIMWRLTGVKAKEYTNATTTGLVNAFSKEFDEYIIESLGLPKKIFKKLSTPKRILGKLKPEISEIVKGNAYVVLCPTHDTASAVEGIAMEDDNIYISSGTWSLLGVKINSPLTNQKSLEANFTNEGGVGYIRYLKNIMGLWIIQNIQKETSMSFSQMVEAARESDYLKLFDVDDKSLLAPENMKNAVLKLISDDVDDKDIINSVYRSLASSYAKAINEIENCTGKKYEKIYIAGGGAKNTYLNELTESFTGKKVIALPIEATALGNLKIQSEVTYDDTI